MTRCSILLLLFLSDDGRAKGAMAGMQACRLHGLMLAGRMRMTGGVEEAA